MSTRTLIVGVIAGIAVHVAAALTALTLVGALSRP